MARVRTRSPKPNPKKPAADQTMAGRDDIDGSAGRSPHRGHDLVAESMQALEAERQRAALAEGEVRELRASTSFRAGQAIAAALGGWRDLIALPGRLAAIARDRGTRALAAAPDLPAGDAQPAQLPVDEAHRAWSRARTGTPAEIGELRVAAVLDEFTRACLEPDCVVELLPTSGFGEHLDRFRPHLLLVESAWRGSDGAWRGLLTPDSAPLLLLLDCCRRRGIPTVFWNKEDPVHFESFVAVAAKFDHVYTTDGALTQRYAERGCREPARLLRFFCQPAMHNPLREDRAPRQRAACYVGSWYHKYPERSRRLAAAIDAVSTRMPVEIFDRNHDRGEESFAFPPRLQPLVRAGVPYAAVADVYRRFLVGINMNTVTDSPTMYSRRVHELAACRTVVATNHSRGTWSDYGDAVIYTDRPEFLARLGGVLEDPAGAMRLTQAALDIVMTRHTARARLAQLAQEVLGVTLLHQPLLRVVVTWEPGACIETLLDSFDAVRWDNKCLLIVTADGAVPGGSVGLERDDVMAVQPGLAVADLPVSAAGERWFLAPAKALPSSYLGRAMAATAYAAGAPLGVAADPADLDRRDAVLLRGSLLVTRQDLHATTLSQLVAPAGSGQSVPRGIAICGEQLLEA